MPSMSAMPRRVTLWAPPRTLSTAVERALIEHPEIQVVHEPFGVPHYWSSEAASAREANDERTSTTFSEVADLIWTKPPPSGKSYTFSKNLAYYFAPHCLPRMSQMLGGDYSQVVHSFIIRHPAKAIASLYLKSCVDNEKTGYTHFDPAEAGFTAMAAILDHVEQQTNAPPCVIIDADDLLEDPEGVMTAYCEAVGLPFQPSMLSWQPGPVKELESPWSGWTDDVINSSGISARAKTSKLPSLDALPLEVRETIAEAIPVYERMHARRLRPSSTASNLRKKVKDALVAGTYTHLDLLEHTEQPGAPPSVGGAKRKPIGASLSVDEVLFKFKTAHPWSAESRAGTPIGNQRIVSLSKPIRAVLSADILLSPLPPPVPVPEPVVA